jgi:hypothetical protein
MAVAEVVPTTLITYSLAAIMVDPAMERAVL